MCYMDHKTKITLDVNLYDRFLQPLAEKLGLLLMIMDLKMIVNVPFLEHCLDPESLLAAMHTLDVVVIPVLASSQTLHTLICHPTLQ